MNPIILEDMRKQGLDPAQWEYDPATHSYVFKETQARPTQRALPAQQPLEDTPDWSSQTGAKMPGKGELLWEAAKESWHDVNKSPLHFERDTVARPTLLGEIGRGTANFGKDVVESVVTPLNAATIPLAVPRVLATAPAVLPHVAKAAGVGFKALVGYGAGELGLKLGDAAYRGVTTGDTGMDNAELTRAVLGGAMLPLMWKGGTHMGKVATQVQADVVASAAAAEAAKAADAARAAKAASGVIDPNDGMRKLLGELPPVKDVAPLEGVSRNAVEPGAALTDTEQVLANQAAKGNPLAAKPLDASAPEMGEVSSKDIQAQQKKYDLAYDRLLENAGEDPKEFRSRLTIAQVLSENPAATPEVALDTQIRETLRTLDLEPQNIVEPITDPDILLGEPPGAFKAPAEASAPIAAPLPEPLRVVPEDFEATPPNKLFTEPRKLSIPKYWEEPAPIEKVSAEPVPVGKTRVPRVFKPEELPIMEATLNLRKQKLAEAQKAGASRIGLDSMTRGINKLEQAIADLKKSQTPAPAPLEQVTPDALRDIATSAQPAAAPLPLTPDALPGASTRVPPTPALGRVGELPVAADVAPAAASKAEPLLPPSAAKSSSSVVEKAPANLTEVQLADAFNKLREPELELLQKYHQHQGKGTIGERSYLEDLKKTNVPESLYDKATFEAARAASDAQLDAQIARNNAFNDKIAAQATSKLALLSDAVKARLTELAAATEKARELKQSLDRSPNDYSPQQRAAATRSYKKASIAESEFQRTHGIDSYEAAGLDVLRRRAKQSATGGGIKIKTGGKPGAGEAGFIDAKAIRDSLKLLAVSARKLGPPPVGAFRAAERMIPSIRARVEPGMSHLGERLQEVFAKRRAYGKWENKFRASIDGYDMAEIEAALEAARRDNAASKGGPESFTASAQLAIDNPKAAKLLESWRDTLSEMAKDQQAAGQPVWDPQAQAMRVRGVRRSYFPEAAARDVIVDVKNNTARGAQLRQDFIDQRMRTYNMTRDAAQAELDKFIGSYDVTGNVQINHADFGAVRKIEGKSLPESWLDPSADRTLNSYARKFARDRASFDVLEKDHDVMHMLGMENDYYGNPVTPKTPNLGHYGGDATVRHVLDEYLGVGSETHNPIIRGMGSMLHALIIQAPSKLWDISSTPVGLLKFLPNGVKDAPGMAYAMVDLHNLKQAYANALSNGFAKQGLSAGKSAYNLINNLARHHETWGEAMLDASTVISRISGSQHLEIVSRAMAQAGGEFVAKLHNDLARVGNAKSIEFMKQLGGDNWSALSESELGTRVAELVQGTYDARNLPYIPPALRPFTSLARWSIEQAYHTKDFSLKPLFEGNATPFITSVAGGYLTAGAINAMLNNVTGVSNALPTAEEAASANTPERRFALQAYRVLAYAQMTGNGGIVTTLAKGILDETLMKQQSRGFTFPLLEATKNVANHAVAAADAIMDGEDPVSVSSAFLGNMLTANVQNVRLIQQTLSKQLGFETPGATADDRARREAFRSQRIYQVSQGLPVRSMQPPKPDYSNLGVREFKRSTVPDAAIAQLPALIERAARRSGGNPDLMKQELQNLRTMPIHAFPDPETNPTQFAQYYTWLEKTKGQEAAKAALAQFYKQRNANAIKRQFVPQLH